MKWSQSLPEQEGGKKCKDKALLLLKLFVLCKFLRIKILRAYISIFTGFSFHDVFLGLYISAPCRLRMIRVSNLLLYSFGRLAVKQHPKCLFEAGTSSYSTDTRSETTKDRVNKGLHNSSPVTPSISTIQVEQSWLSNLFYRQTLRRRFNCLKKRILGM